MDYESDTVREFVAKHVCGEDLVSDAVKLYYAVRDGLRYEVYGNDLSREGMKASAIIQRAARSCATCLLHAASTDGEARGPKMDHQ